MVSATEGWAVGGSSAIYHFDGTTWTKIPTANLPSGVTGLTAVQALSATDIWVVGTSGAIWRSTNGGSNATFALSAIQTM